MNMETMRAEFEAWAGSAAFDTSFYEGYEGMPGWYKSGETQSAWRAWQAALAARQPVGHVPIGFTTCRNGKYSTGLFHSRKNAELFLHDIDGGGKPWHAEQVIPVYAAPPAQAVDLEAFAPAVVGLEIAANFQTDAGTASRMRETATSLRALIDGQKEQP